MEEIIMTAGIFNFVVGWFLRRKNKENPLAQPPFAGIHESPQRKTVRPILKKAILQGLRQRPATLDQRSSLSPPWCSYTAAQSKYDRHWSHRSPHYQASTRWNIPAWERLCGYSMQPISPEGKAPLFPCFAQTQSGILVSDPSHREDWKWLTAQNRPLPRIFPTWGFSPNFSLRSWPRYSPISRTFESRLSSRMIFCTRQAAAHAIGWPW